MLSVFFYLLISSASARSPSFEKDFFENQLVLGDERANMRNAMKSPASKWPNGVVPYTFGADYIERDVAAVLNAMDIFHKETCIKFILKRDYHAKYIRFRKSRDGCGTFVGYQAEPSHDVYLAENCLKISAAIQHELLHTLGLWHEQSRPDRDEYVDIIWENIIPRHTHNFDKKDNDLVETFDLPYDYESLMHYPNNAFAKPGANVTIVSKKDPNRKLGQFDGPTKYDLEKIRKMYNC